MHWILEYLFYLPSKYTTIEVILLGLGFLSWILAYYFILKGARKYKFVEIPFVIVALDLAWEFNWAFLLENDLGRIFVIGSLLWFTVDLFINYNALKLGPKLVNNEWIKRNYIPIYLFFLISGGFIFYWMREVAEDNGLGVISAYLLNINISGFYLYQLLSFPEYRNKGISYKVGFLKFLGTFFISMVCLLHWSHNGFLLTMCAMVTIMDLLYLYLFKNYKITPLAK